MNETIGIGALAEALVGTFGKTGGRNLLLQNLRSGALNCVCDYFYGLKPSAYRMAPYPDSQADFALPRDFWNWDWSHDGELVRPGIGQLDTISLFAEWPIGNFCWSGTYGNRRTQHVLRAMGVGMEKAEALAFLASQNLKPLAPPVVIPPPSQQRWKAWTNDQTDYLVVSEAKLLARARAHFPRHHISRQMIRDWRGSQQRGRKPSATS